MTDLKMDSKVAAAASEAMEPWVRRLYERPGMRIMAIAELARVDRNDPDPDFDNKSWVKVRITHLEVPNSEQEGVVRESMKALYMQRTVAGKLDEDGQIELGEGTLRLAAGMLHAIEAARLKAAVQHWSSYARRVVHGPDLTVSEMKHEMDTIADGLSAALSGARPDTDDSTA